MEFLRWKYNNSVQIASYYYKLKFFAIKAIFREKQIHSQDCLYLEWLNLQIRNIRSYHEENRKNELPLKQFFHTVRHMRRTPYESAAAPTVELNIACRSKPKLPNQTDSNATLLLYLTHQLGSAHEWSGVWTGPKSMHNDATLLRVFEVQNTVFIFCMTFRVARSCSTCSKIILSQMLEIDWVNRYFMHVMNLSQMLSDYLYMFISVVSLFALRKSTKESKLNVPKWITKAKCIDGKRVSQWVGKNTLDGLLIFEWYCSHLTGLFQISKVNCVRCLLKN